MLDRSAVNAWSDLGVQQCLARSSRRPANWIFLRTQRFFTQIIEFHTKSCSILVVTGTRSDEPWLCSFRSFAGHHSCAEVFDVNEQQIMANAIEPLRQFQRGYPTSAALKAPLELAHIVVAHMRLRIYITGCAILIAEIGSVLRGRPALQAGRMESAR